LYSTKAKDDWGKGTLTIRKRKNKLVLPLYPSSYHGEIQLEDSDITTENQSETESEKSDEEQTQKVNKELDYKSLGFGDYLLL